MGTDKIKKRERKNSESSDLSKRNFMIVFSGFIGSIIGLAISFPVVGFLFHPLRKKTVYGSDNFIKVGMVSNLKEGQPTKAAINSFKVDGWNRYDNLTLGATWLIKQNNNEIVAMSTICPHLGCGIDWNVEKKLFVCPCHSSIFDIKGTVVSGPAPRSMDTLDTKIEGDDVFVKYRKLRLSTAKKIEV